MKHLHWGHCTFGVAVAAVALIALGVSPGTLAFFAVVAACPLMMLVMMKTMAGNDRSKSHTGPPSP